MSSPGSLQLRDLRKVHSDAFQLRIDQLDIATGEILCLLGPTGSGKSTLLRILAGLELANGGEVRLDGQSFSPAGLPLEVQRQLTLVFQRPLLLSGSVRHNVQYGLRLRRQLAPDGADRWLEQLGLMPLADRSAHHLSGGQAQLVALARALAIEPKVLLLDEPTASLDPARVALVERLIRQDHQRRQTTVLWATHNLFQARRLADRVALLLGGQLIEVAPTRQFFEAPADPRTRAFVEGKMVY